MKQFLNVHTFEPHMTTQGTPTYSIRTLYQNILYHKPDIILVHKLEQALNI